MFTNTYAPLVGGVERAVASTAEALRRQGHACLVVAPSHPHAAPEPEIVRLPALESLLGSEFSYRLPASGRLRRRFDDFAPDVVHVHHPFMLGEAGLRRARARGLPVVFTSHTRWERFVPRSSFSSKWIRRLAQQLPVTFGNLCDAVVAPTASIARLLRRRGVTVPVRVVPTGLDPSVHAGADRGRGRERWRLHQDAPVVGHLGRLVPEKNLGYLADAVGEVLERLPEARFLLVGEGPSAIDLRRRLVDRGVADRLVPTGLLSGAALADAYAAMDVFAFSSLTDTQGLVLVEAMAAGRPVVALDAPGPRDLVDASNGFLVAAAAPASEFAAALLGALERKCALRTGALSSAASYDLDTVVRKLVEVYVEAAQRVGVPRIVDRRRWRFRMTRRLRSESQLLAQKASLAWSVLR